MVEGPSKQDDNKRSKTTFLKNSGINTRIGSQQASIEIIFEKLFPEYKEKREMINAYSSFEYLFHGRNEHIMQRF